MATATHLTTGQQLTPSSTQNTASITPGANRLVLVTVRYIVGVGQVAPVPTLSGNGITYVQVTTGLDASERRRITLYRGKAASPSAGAITIGNLVNSPAFVDWIVDEVDGAETVVQAVFGKQEGTNTGLTITLNGFSNNNGTYGAISSSANLAGITEGTGFTELVDSGTSGRRQSQFKSTPDTSVDWSYTSTDTISLAVAAEIHTNSGALFFSQL
jgi:hypothetical protein